MIPHTRHKLKAQNAYYKAFSAIIVQAIRICLLCLLVLHSINPMSIMPSMASPYMSMQRDVPSFQYSDGYSA